MSVQMTMNDGGIVEYDIGEICWDIRRLLSPETFTVTRLMTLLARRWLGCPRRWVCDALLYRLLYIPLPGSRKAAPACTRTASDLLVKLSG